VISLKRSISDYEVLQTLSAVARDLLISTVESVRQYAVETDPATVEQFRNHLTGTIKRLRGCLEAQDGDGLSRLRTEIRGELRDYHDRSARYVDHLRTELNNAGRALNELLATCQSDTCAEQKLSDTIAQVRGLESARSLDDVKINARRIAISIAQCAEQIKLERDSVVVQLRDEIRTLQKTVEQAQRAARVDDLTGCYNRVEVERLIRREIVSGRPITVLHIWLRNFELLRDLHSVAIVDQLVVSFSKRVGRLAKEAVLGRWQSDMFCLVSDSTAARDLGSNVLRNCAGEYVCMDKGTDRTLKIQLTVTHLAPQPGADIDAFIQKIESVNAKQRE
jgi:GGDEF domain-containing protein